MPQSLSQMLLHVIFSTKDRHPFITENIQPELYAYMISISTSLGCFIHEIGGIQDHVHLLVGFSRTLSMSELLEEIKKNSSKWMKTKGKDYQDFSWQKGYGVFSVSKSQQEAVVRYLKNQKEHHKKQSFQDEYREFLNLNNISFDERYVWD